MGQVTVIIPTFNRETMIRHAVESVLKQTYTNYEILIIDDGSSDNTEQALGPWLSQIHYIKKENGGPSSARNKGIRHASSDYVAFLDSDDQWEPNFLQTVVDASLETPALGLVTTGRLVFPKGIPRPRIPNSRLEGDLYPLLFQSNFVTTSGVLVKRECFDRVGLFNEKLDQAEDYDMWLRIAKEYPIAFLNKYLCRWHQHHSNISRYELRHQLCLQQVLENNYDSTRISLKFWHLRRSRALVSLGKAYWGEHQRSHAHQCFRKAIQLTPWRIRPWRYFLQTAW